MRILAIGGPKGAGKDTAAQFLLARNSLLQAQLFQQVNFADALKGACGMIFGLTLTEMYDASLKEVVLDRWPYKCPRELMQNVANVFRTLYAPDIWVRSWERKIKLISTGCVVVTDLRHPEEITKLQELGAKILYVHNPTVEASRTKGIAEGDPLWCNSSESFSELIRASADCVLENEGTNLQALYTNMEKCIDSLFGDFTQWPESQATLKHKGKGAYA